MGTGEEEEMRHTSPLSNDLSIEEQKRAEVILERLRPRDPDGVASGSLPEMASAVSQHSLPHWREVSELAEASLTFTLPVTPSRN